MRKIRKLKDVGMTGKTWFKGESGACLCGAGQRLNLFLPLSWASSSSVKYSPYFPSEQTEGTACKMCCNYKQRGDILGCGGRGRWGENEGNGGCGKEEGETMAGAEGGETKKKGVWRPNC